MRTATCLALSFAAACAPSSTPPPSNVAPAASSVASIASSSSAPIASIAPSTSASATKPIVICDDCGGTPVILFLHFAKGSSALDDPNLAIAREMAQVIVDHPEITLVEIDAFADDPGDEKANLKLSEARAKSVVAALVADGVASTRVRGVGFGNLCPVDPAPTDAAHAKNRRAEAKIVRNAEGPTGVETGCPPATAKGIVSPPP